MTHICREMSMSFSDALNLTWFQVAAICEMLEKRYAELKRRQELEGQKKLKRLVNG